MTAAHLARAQREARAAHALALFAVIALIVTFTVSYVLRTLTALATLGPEANGLEQVTTVLAVWVPALTIILFLDALSWLRRALAEYAEAQFFSPRAARAVRIAGERALLALAAKIAIVPTILALIGEDRFGLRIELTDLPMLAFVGFIALVGRVLYIAAAVKADSDQIV